jgi:hypothetical protein
MIIAVRPVSCRDETLAVRFSALAQNAIALMLVLLLAGCIKAATTTYSSATDERSLGVQVEDTRISAKVKRGLLETGVKNAMALDVFCHRGVVVLAGVAEPKVAEQSVAIAQKVEGVKRVETYLLPERLPPRAISRSAPRSRRGSSATVISRARRWRSPSSPGTSSWPGSSTVRRRSTGSSATRRRSKAWWT